MAQLASSLASCAVMFPVCTGKSSSSDLSYFFSYLSIMVKIAPWWWDLGVFFFEWPVDEVVNRKLCVSLRALSTNQFVSCKSVKFKQLLVDTLVSLAKRSAAEPTLDGDLWPAIKQTSLTCLGCPWTHLLAARTTTEAHGRTCPVGAPHSIPWKLCLLFTAMLDHLTCFCCYVTAASLWWTVRAEQPES